MMENAPVMGRSPSYAIVFVDSAKRDLADLGEAATQVVGAIYGLRDEDVHDWMRIEVGSAEGGPWVAFQMAGQWVMARWDPGNLEFWFQPTPAVRTGACLTIVRIVPPAVFMELMQDDA
jgi:hypothetical protein